MVPAILYSAAAIGIIWLAVTGCTVNYSITLTDTHGMASDVVDEAEKASTEASVEVPIKLH